MSVWNEGSKAADTVERVAVEPIQPRPRRTTPLHAVVSEHAPDAAVAPPPPEPPAPIYIERPPSLNDHIQAAFSAIARILAIKLQLLLTLLGAFVLALGAMAWQSPMGLAVLIAWCALAVLPMVWLDYAGRQRRP